MFRRLISLAAAGAAAVALVATAGVSHAADEPLSGAIFTTNGSGEPVNLNLYPSKEDVYLNGGPGVNAPADAAGLPAGTYTFQVTDPSGKTVLSSDPLACRQVTVDASGVFTGVVAQANGCEHELGTGYDDYGVGVQLFPYDDTPNRGGVYKVWLTQTGDLACTDSTNPDCFVPSLSKTDNFKVRQGEIVEIDTRFWKNGVALDGMKATWTDTLGARNVKYSEWNPAVLAYHEAHVEAAEQGNHKITVADQAGCTIASVTTPTGQTLTPTGGTVTVPVAVKNHKAGDRTYFVDVRCAG